VLTQKVVGIVENLVEKKTEGIRFHGKQGNNREMRWKIDILKETRAIK
jgi:hypothetical protein